MDEFEQQLTEIDVYGFTVVENVLDADEVEEMRESLIQSEKERGTDESHRGPARHVANLITYDPVFFKCIDHPQVLPFIEAVMGENIILGSLNSRIVRPGDGYQGLHADVPGELLRGSAAPVMMNTVWPLCDYSAERGATRVVPGTHRSGLLGPPEDFDVKYEFQPVCPAGSVIIFNGQTWHGGGQNTSDQVRPALFGHYRVNAWMRFQLDPHHNFPEKWLDLLNERQKRLLRMDRGLGYPHGADDYEGL